ncbi:hypothetical protein [Thorsellia kenyensis]|uniref:Uncharacterized protein n=1 Tax=Thorsellia kenyensis TaxID=1549888 RepID=A0ABV6C7H2_9GAMM
MTPKVGASMRGLHFQAVGAKGSHTKYMVHNDSEPGAYDRWVSVQNSAKPYT